MDNDKQEAELQGSPGGADNARETACRPILFSGPMVRSILDGSKTQTRRVIKPQPVATVHKGETPPLAVLEAAIPELMLRLGCPYGKVGDWLWVKETHYLYGRWFKNGQTKTGKQKWRFKASEDFGAKFPDDPPSKILTLKDREDGIGWFKRVSIHMPRFASRITLEITEVRVQRLQEINAHDAVEEASTSWTGLAMLNAFRVQENAKEHFGKLWDSLNAGRGYGWDLNPWVWVIGFKVAE